mmetsp:Transcript_85675/g.135968  ORF Transcript_85675/g.135968 Transcript_85675/m.135968 type:complete len:250 (-) Transcript_85675:743-1492(-)
MLIPSKQEWLLEPGDVSCHDGHTNLQQFPNKANFVCSAIVRWHARVVATSSVNPAGEEGMIPIFQAFISMVEIVGTAFTKHLAILLSQWCMYHGETSSFRLCHPLPVRRALDSIGWPVRTIDSALCNIKLSIFPQGYGSVARMGSHAKGQDRIQAIQADDPNEVSTVNLRLVQDRLISGRGNSFLHLNAPVLFQEVHIPLGCQWCNTFGVQRCEQECRIQDTSHGGKGILMEGKDPDAQVVHIPRLSFC